MCSTQKESRHFFNIFRIPWAQFVDVFQLTADGRFIAGSQDGHPRNQCCYMIPFFLPVAIDIIYTHTLATGKKERKERNGDGQRYIYI